MNSSPRVVTQGEKVRAKVVVGVPVFNEARFVEETLRSLSAQTYTLFKVLVSDNASTDGTSEICDRFCQNDDRFVFHRHPENRGSAANFNFCLDNSDSDYFIWCGGHDLISEDYLRRAAETLDSQPSVAISCSKMMAVGEDSNPREELLGAYYKFSDVREIRYLQSLCQLSDCTMANAMFRRNHVEGFGFTPVAGPDLVFLSRLLWFGRVSYDPEICYFRRFLEQPKQTYMERITATPGSAVDYNGMIETYLKDMERLRKLGFPKNSLYEELARLILSGRFLGGRVRRISLLCCRILSYFSR